MKRNIDFKYEDYFEYCLRHNLKVGLYKSLKEFYENYGG